MIIKTVLVQRYGTIAVEVSENATYSEVIEAAKKLEEDICWSSDVSYEDIVDEE